ncbi:MAG: PAS domain S-box protein [Methanomicrobiales archaeon]
MSAVIRVLYVDDEPLLLEIAKRYLEKSGDFSVTTISSASAALDLLKTGQFDAVISDYQMPEIDGLEFLQQVRHIYGEVPFILFTGRGREEVVILALNYGADFYLQKGGAPQPQFTELAHKIRQAVQRRRADIALLESERRYRDIVETQTEFISRFKPDGTHVFVNEAYCRHFGKQREDVIGHRFIPSIPPEDREIVRRHFASLTRDHPVGDLEHRVIMPNGSIRWHWWSDHVIFDEAGNVVEYQSLGKDITDRKRVEEELLASIEKLEAAEVKLRAQFAALNENQQRIEQSEQDYRNILENMQDVYYRSDDRGNLILASPSLATLLGYASVSEMYGKKIAQILYYNPDERELVIADIQKNGSINNYEVRLKKQDGTPVIVSTSSHEYFDADGNYRGVEGIFRDITERKDAEDTLKRSENLYRTIFEMTGAATIIIEEDTIISLANSGFAKISGYSIEGLESKKKWTDFVVKEDLERMKKYHSDRRNDPPSAPKVYEFQFINRSGEIRHCINNVAVIPGTTRSVASVVDITDRVAIEQTLKESENLYRTIFHNTGAATIIIAPDTTILLANDGWINLTGVPRKEQENRRSWTEFIDPDDLERMTQYHYARRNDPTLPPNAYECKLVDAENSVHRCLVHVDMIPGSKNSVASLVDITSRIQAEELYQTVFENTGTAMLILEEDTTISHINDEMEIAWGYSREEIEGRMKWPQLVAEADVGKMLEYHHLRRTSPGSAPKNYEFRTVHKNGESRYASLAVAMIPGTKKSVISIRDITEFKNTELALVKCEGIFRQLEGELPDYVLIHEGETIVFVNAEGARLMGKTPQKIVGTSVLSYAAPEYHTLIKKNLALRHQGVEVEPYDIEIIIPSGEHRWVVVRATPLRDREKPATLTVLTDITERKRAEETLRKSEAKYRTIIENMQDLVYQTDLQGNLIMISPTGIRLAGYSSPDDVLGKNIARDLYADPKQREELLAVLADKGAVKDFPVTLNAGDGTIRYATASSHFYYDAKGQVLGVEGVLHDVTERKQAEEALLQANRKLNLLSSITRHDINNQLAVQMGYLELLEDGPFDPTQNKYFLEVSTAARRISSMIRFMKEYEAIGITTPVWQRVRALIETAVKDAPPGSIMVNNDLPVSGEVFADPLIAKVFYNLMDNAFRYGGKITNIRFYALESDGNHVIVCEDDGDGVPANEKEKIFERGFGKNTGLGLALSREILDITGITIRETGEPGKGARFEITVPGTAYRSTGTSP